MPNLDNVSKGKLNVLSEGDKEMQKVIEKLKEIKSNDIGLSIYSSNEQKVVTSLNSEIAVPLASAAKVAIGFCIVKWVEEGLLNWNDSIEDISLNPNEDSNELYPHLQNRKSLALHEAVEVMIACHDSFVANRVVQVCGGWEEVNKQIKSHFSKINVTQDPRDIANSGEINQVLELICYIFEQYQTIPELWTPIVNGLVRQQGEVNGIPHHMLNHMTGGLANVIINIGILGEFHKNPYLYVLAAKKLPNRLENVEADHKIVEAMQLLFEEYLKQVVVIEKS